MPSAGFEAHSYQSSGRTRASQIARPPESLSSTLLQVILRLQNNHFHVTNSLPLYMTPAGGFVSGR